MGDLLHQSSGIGIITILLLASNILFSYRGFKDRVLFDQYCFHVDKILIGKEYVRMLSSGFLHGSWTHLIFNMATLYFFSDGLESTYGITVYLAIYFGSLIGGNLLALFVHKNHGDYTAVGASGAVTGLIFAAIALFPGMKLHPIFIPIGIPSWLFGIAYVLYSIYGIKSNRDNIGHEAHLGGGVVGVLIAVFFFPQAISENPLPIFLILIPSVIFIVMIIFKPNLLMFNSGISRQQKKPSVEENYLTQQIHRRKEIDQLLDKIHKKGIHSLSKKEKARLEELTK
ncbi:MAG: rhomboid family intramembrane serine protease [Flavobacteriales bacterium]